MLVSGCARPGADAEDRSALEGGGAGGPASKPAEGAEPGDGAPVCLLGGPFVADGVVEVPAGTARNAYELVELRWHRYEGCERFVIDLTRADGGGAHRAGEVTAEVLRDRGVVRVRLHDVESVDPGATEASFEGPLVRAAYSVFSPEGRGVYVDVHLGEAAEASVTVVKGPARVLVDVRPGGGRVPPLAPSRARVVVLEPRPGLASYPLTVTGYARTFEANVVVRLEQNGQDVYRDFTTATAWADAWGHYSFTVREGPSGTVILHVGEHSARGGSWEGVAIPIEVR